jgi:hypothetical protein
MQTNAETFKTILASNYVKLFETPEYALAASRYSPEALAEKMTAGLISGSANKDGDGIRMTCKHLGIKTTYKAIREYLTAGTA